MRRFYLFSCLALLALFSIGLGAGTIKFKDGSTLTDATIVSISEGDIWIEKDKTKKKFPLKSIESFSATNLSANAAIEGVGPGEYIDYDISILNIKMPKDGEDKDGKTQSCEITYSISKKKSPENAKKIKIPYVYLYVLTSRPSETEERKIYRYCYPEDDARPKGKGYDKAAVMEKVNAFDRKEWDDQDGLNTLSAGGKLGGRTFKFELSKIGDKRILAYHLEVWGNNSIIAEKSEIVPQMHLEKVKVGERWWERY